MPLPAPDRPAAYSASKSSTCADTHTQRKARSTMSQSSCSIQCIQIQHLHRQRCDTAQRWHTPHLSDSQTDTDTDTGTKAQTQIRTHTSSCAGAHTNHTHTLMHTIKRKHAHTQLSHEPNQHMLATRLDVTPERETPLVMFCCLEL